MAMDGTEATEIDDEFNKYAQEYDQQQAEKVKLDLQGIQQPN